MMRVQTSIVRIRRVLSVPFLVGLFSFSALASAQESDPEGELKIQEAATLSYKGQTNDLDAQLARQQRNYTIAGSTLLVAGAGGMVLTVWAANEPENLGTGVAVGAVLGVFFAAAGAAGIGLLVRRRQVKKERQALRVSLGPGHIVLAGSF